MSEANHSIADVESIEDTPGGVPERLVESVESDSIITCEDDALEDLPPADSSEVWQSDFMIGHSVQEIATDETAAPDAGSKPLARKGKTLPQTELLLPMICLDDDPVRVDDLAKKLELKTCQVINSLIDIGISANPGDIIDVRKASQIAERFGFRVLK